MINHNNLTTEATNCYVKWKAYPGPSMKMQGCKLSKIWLVHMDVETLTLVNITSTINSHINQSPLLDFPNSPNIKK